MDQRPFRLLGRVVDVDVLDRSNLLAIARDESLAAVLLCLHLETPWACLVDSD